MSDQLTRDELAAYVLAFVDRHDPENLPARRLFSELVEHIEWLGQAQLIALIQTLETHAGWRDTFFRSGIFTDFFSADNVMTYRMDFPHLPGFDSFVFGTNANYGALFSNLKHTYASRSGSIQNTAEEGDGSKPLDAKRPRRRGRGIGRGLITIHSSFNDPLPSDVQASFET